MATEEHNNNLEDVSKLYKRKKRMMQAKTSNMDKRVKERYIEKVREKVSEWRGLHEIGMRDAYGNFEKLNLD